MDGTIEENGNGTPLLAGTPLEDGNNVIRWRWDLHLPVMDLPLVCARVVRESGMLFVFVLCNWTSNENFLGAFVKEVNDFFEHELQFLGEYHAHLKEAALRTEKMTNKHKEVADAHVRLPSVLTTLSTAEHGTMEKFIAKTSDIFEKFRFSEHGRPHRQRPGHIAGDTLRYYQRDSNAAKALLIRRAHSATPKKWTRKVTSRRRFASADDNMQ
uniref:Sorting nexin-6 n=2 Tax=Culex pipiens TaxID=7175 RepID=A0A8D8HT87_CULPI